MQFAAANAIGIGKKMAAYIWLRGWWYKNPTYRTAQLARPGNCYCVMHRGVIFSPKVCVVNLRLKTPFDFLNCEDGQTI